MMIRRALILGFFLFGALALTIGPYTDQRVEAQGSVTPPPPLCGISPSCSMLPLVMHNLPTPDPSPSPPPPPLTAVQNGSFEVTPDDGWMEMPEGLIYSTADRPRPMPEGETGTHYAWLGGARDQRNSLTQPITLTAGHQVLKLVYRYWLSSNEDACPSGDSALVMVGSTVLKRYDLCEANRTFDPATGHGWRDETLIIGAGSDAESDAEAPLSFESSLDPDTALSSFYVDNVALCSADPRARPQDQCK